MIISGPQIMKQNGKANSYYITLPWVRNLGAAQLDPLLLGLSLGCHPGVSWGCFLIRHHTAHSWQLAGGLSSSPRGPLQTAARDMSTGFRLRG